MIAGGIHKDKLGILPGDNATNPITGGLGFVGNDGYFFAYQIIG